MTDNALSRSISGDSQVAGTPSIAVSGPLYAVNFSTPKPKRRNRSFSRPSGVRLHCGGAIDEDRRGRDHHHQPPRQIHLSRTEICLKKRSHPSLLKFECYAMMDLLRQGRNVPARPRSGRGLDRGHRELHRGEPDPRLRQAVPGGSGPGLWQMPPVSRVQSAAAEPEAQGQATPASTRKGTARCPFLPTKSGRSTS